MLEAIKDNTTPRGIYLADFGVSSKPCWWVSGKRALSLFLLILKRTIYVITKLIIRALSGIAFSICRKGTKQAF